MGVYPTCPCAFKGLGKAGDIAPFPTAPYCPGAAWEHVPNATPQGHGKAGIIIPFLTSLIGPYAAGVGGLFAPVVPYGGAARGAFRTCCDRHCARTGTTPDKTKQTETRQTENNNRQTEKRRQRQSSAFPVPDRGQLLLNYGRAPCKQKSYLANFSLVYLSWEACERGCISPYPASAPQMSLHSRIAT